VTHIAVKWTKRALGCCGRRQQGFRTSAQDH